jgi:hypothetical protein
VLQDSGAEIVDLAHRDHADALVALMSPDAVADRDWQKAARGLEAKRLIPVRLAPFDDEEVPERLREINWIEWDAANPSAALGVVIASIYSDPERHRIGRQLEHEAEAWHQAGRPESLLIEDYTRSQQARDLLVELQSDELAVPTPVTTAFVEHSLVVARRLYKRRRRRRAWALIVAVVAASLAASVLPKISLGGKINRAAIVTAGDEGLLDKLPEWSAVESAELLVHGTATQKELGRRTLERALARPWRLSEFDYIDSARAAVPYDHGRRVAVLALSPSGSGLAIIDLRRGASVWSAGLGHRFNHIDVSPDGRVAVVAGPGLATIDLAARRMNVRASAGVSDARIMPGTGLVTWSASGLIQARSPSGEVIRNVGRYRSVLAVETNAQHGAAALVRLRSGRYEIVDVTTARVVARTDLRGFRANTDRGDLNPDLSRAIVEGADGQLWTFGIDEPTRPTGVVVPVDLTDVLWRPNDRIVLASDSERGQVIALPGGERLGHICWGVPELPSVRADRTSDVVACGGRSVWSLPDGPSKTMLPGLSARTNPRGPLADIETKGSRYRVHVHEPLGSGVTAWAAPLNSRITAASFSPDGRQILLGSDNSGVAMVGLIAAGARTLKVWNAPDEAPVLAVGWYGEEPIVRTTAGHTWHLPACPNCQTDSGLLAAARSRLPGCLTSRQLRDVSGDVRRLLDIRVCEPVHVLP